ncbi:hypothetical protein D3C73_808200 [compost metagenome]
MKCPFYYLNKIGGFSYQILIRLSVGINILSPSFVSQAAWNASKLMIGANARYCAGECGSVFT